MSEVSARDLTRPHVWRPSENSSTSKTLLLLHGTGADEHDLLSLGKAIDPTANLLSPRGLVVENGMNRFFIRYPDGSFDEPSIIEGVDELADFIAAAQLEYGFDPANVYAVGFSNGANTAGALLIMHPETIAGIAAFGTTKSFSVSPKSPDLTGKKVWIANGELDTYSPADKTTAMIAELESLGADVELFMHPGGHQIVMDHVQQIHRKLA